RTCSARGTRSRARAAALGGVRRALEALPTRSRIASRLFRPSLRPATPSARQPLVPDARVERILLIVRHATLSLACFHVLHFHQRLLKSQPDESRALARAAWGDAFQIFQHAIGNLDEDLRHMYII